MTNNNLTSYHHGNLKEALIKEALVMVGKSGVESITLREITTKVGASRSAIYRHFSSKDELVKAVIQAGFEILDNAIRPTLLSDDTVLNRLQNMGKAYIAFAIENPKVYRMIFGHEVQSQREESCDINDETQAKGFHALVSLLREGQEKKVFKEGDPALLATYVWSNVHGVSILLIDGHLHVKENLEALFELSYDVMINGMKR